MESGLVISNVPEISASYFALLQCGYDYYSIEREQKHAETIQRFMGCAFDPDFFSNVKQDSCEVYPYWPRAFILETASFYLSSDRSGFSDFAGFRQRIMGADNISNSEKDEALWKWIKGFPAAMHNVLSDRSFQNYLAWENQWISVQNDKYRTQLQKINEITDICIHQYHSPVTQLKIVLNPIKCVYSADYLIHENCFVFSSGRFQVESIVHEFLHHVVHPFILQRKGFIIEENANLPDIDRSYYLSGDDTGKLNAFEEYAVRRLTADVLEKNYPDNLADYLRTIV